MKITNILIQYFVEGECEEHLIKSVKNKYILSGKIKVLNVTMKKITLNHIRLLSPKTICVFVIDVDTYLQGNNTTEILEKNIKLLESKKFKVVLIPQINNLEEEIIYSTSVKKCFTELLGIASKKDFKKEFIKCTKLLEKLEEKNFDINKLWSRDATIKAKCLKNMSKDIKA